MARPFKVVTFDKSQYNILNLITHKTRDVHASQLKVLRFDPTKKSPTDTAHRDYIIEDILSHVGNKSKPSTMRFH